MKTRYKIIGIAITLSFVIPIAVISFPFQTQYAPLSIPELEEKHKNSETVIHFQSIYPSYSVQMGFVEGSTRSHFMYIATNEERIAELRTVIDFISENPKFTYMCSNIDSEQIFVNIENPSIEDIDNNQCW